MHIISPEQCETALSKYYRELSKIPYEAWNEWKVSSVAQRMAHKSVRAMNVWNNMVGLAEDRFADQALGNTDWVKLGHQNGLLLEGKFFVRLKKGDTQLKSKNYPTQSALKFHDQETDLFGGLCRLELIYVLDKHEMNVDQVALVQRHKGQVVFVRDLSNLDVDIQMPVINIQPLRPPPSTTTAAHIIKLNKPETNDEQVAEQNGTGGNS